MAGRQPSEARVKVGGSSLGSDGEASAEGAQSLRRALAILRTLAVGGEDGLRLIDVTRTTGLNRPTAHRLLRVLKEEGIVEQSTRTRRYAIGEQIPQLALARARPSALLIAAEPHLKRAAETFGDTVFLTIRTGLDTLCVARRLGRFPVQVLLIEVGARRPLGVSSAGIAMLAAMPEEEADDVLTRNADRLRPYRITLPRAGDLVAEVRAQGFALRTRGLVPGTRAVSVAVEATDRSPAGALTVTAMDRRLTGERIETVVEFLRHAASRIEYSLYNPAFRSA